MEIFLTSISGILVILGMILVGFVMGEKGWFDDKSRGLIAKLVTQIALPCYMLYTITQRFTAADLLKMLPDLRFPALSMVILLGIATAVARIFAVKKDRRGRIKSKVKTSTIAAITKRARTCSELMVIIDPKR